ncbi:alcohol dehydrogenase catalytic domain-containing protein [Roseospira visakhapatnamensis]|uniref:2-desacetyl-2-hydroxyethyl bacteriochlorophyllide A dehydrogenase n=1 Tax=Roseospira visakhapatnamensis TaxID=390880 RepID=A0A7W6RE65_9PROT|nr:alcohol dehydrogenase catalytic domain-containing protein [Roseospira visakhapatnamensis]MBB4266384.1 2-desacetyl-2-hydroxyethyl bacteriochlorophyllide A dehydrogenase [Roseospira visakhapatnamensis]
MKSLVFAQPGQMSIEDLPRPEPTGDEVLIKVEASGICGTDVHIFQGGFSCDYPLVPGHEFAGAVVEVGPACTRFKVGDRVAVEPNVPCNNCPECLRGEHHYCRNMVVPGVNRPGGMAEYVLVKERGAFDIGTLPYDLGALVEPLSCVVHAAERLAPQVGERVLVMGAGPIGLLMGRMIRARGAARVDYLERNPDRRDYAARMGLGHVYDTTDAIPDKAYDAAADATGVSALVSEAVNRLVRPRGRVLVFGVPSQTAKIEIDHFRFYREEVQLIASFTSLKNSIQAVDIMANEVIDVHDIISHKINLSDCPDFIRRMQAGDGDMRKVTVTDFAT